MHYFFTDHGHGSNVGWNNQLCSVLAESGWGELIFIIEETVSNNLRDIWPLY